MHLYAQKNIVYAKIAGYRANFQNARQNAAYKFNQMSNKAQKVFLYTAEFGRARPVRCENLLSPLSFFCCFCFFISFFVCALFVLYDA